MTKKRPPTLRPPGADVPEPEDVVIKDPDPSPIEPKRVDDPTLLERVFTKRSVEGPNALSHNEEIVPRARISFDVDGAECAPGMFVDDDGPITFRLTLVSLTSAQEISITKGVSDPAEAVQLTAKASLEKLNGAPVLGDQVLFLWEALGPGGRQLVLTMYQEIGAISPAGLGKASASSTRE